MMSKLAHSSVKHMREIEIADALTTGELVELKALQCPWCNKGTIYLDTRIDLIVCGSCEWEGTKAPLLAPSRPPHAQG